MATLKFTYDGLLLDSKCYDHSLLVIGFTYEQKANCISIDGGSTINILPLKTINNLRIPTNELSHS